jgi:hypothetical protein
VLKAKNPASRISRRLPKGGHVVDVPWWLSTAFAELCMHNDCSLERDWHPATSAMHAKIDSTPLVRSDAKIECQGEAEILLPLRPL